MFMGLLTGLVNGSNHTKCVSLSNQKHITQLTLINLLPNEYSHPNELHYYSFGVKSDRCVRSCNNDLSNFFFYLGFLARPFTNYRTAGEGGGHSSLPLPPASQTLRH